MPTRRQRKPPLPNPLPQGEGTHPRSPAPQLLFATLITLLAAALRFINLGHDSLWFDEALTRQTAAAGLAAALAVRDHVPLLYWLTTAVLRLLPEHEVTLRLVSALAGVLAVPLLAALGRAVRLPGAGLWAALLLAVSPFHIRYSQEARHYALLLLFGLLATVLLLRALERGRMRDWAAYGVAAALALLTHYSAWLLLLAQAGLVAGWLLGRLRAGQRDAVARLAPAAAVAGLTLLLLAPGATEAIRANTAAAVGTTAAASLGVWLRALGLEFGFLRPGPAWVLGLAAIIGAVVLAQRRPAAAGALIVSAVAPVLLIQALGITRFALPKYVIYLLALYLFAAGVGVSTLLRRWSFVVGGASAVGRGRAGAAGSFAAAAVVLLVAWPAVAAEYAQMIHDWRGAAAALGPAEPGDVVLAVALDTSDGFNAAGVMAPVYLDPGFRLLDGNHLTAAELEALVGAGGWVSALVLNLLAPVTVDDSRWVAANHQGSLYSLARVGVGDAGDVRRTQERATHEESASHEEGASHKDDVLEQLAALYEQLIPQAIPAAACDLTLRLTHVQLARGDNDAAAAALAAHAPDCPANADARAATTAVRHPRQAIQRPRMVRRHPPSIVHRHRRVEIERQRRHTAARPRPRRRLAGRQVIAVDEPETGVKVGRGHHPGGVEAVAGVQRQQQHHVARPRRAQRRRRATPVVNHPLIRLGHGQPGDQQYGRGHE